MGPPGAPASPYNPYGDPNQLVQVHMAHAQQMSRRITSLVLGITVGVFVLTAAIVVLTIAL
jgi:hypothetical protein